MQASNLIYDGTFDGFLTCVFYVYEYKLEYVAIQKENTAQNLLFSELEIVTTDTIKADRVWSGLKSKLLKTSTYQIYYAFLSEKEAVENILLDYIKHAFESTVAVDKDFAHPTVLKISQIAKMVGREKHRMEAFVRFKLTKDNIYFANIAPDFNVLPLISKHFKSRYADQKWVIYDLKRHYGLYYNLKNVEIINLNFSDEFNPTKTSSEIFSDEEFKFQKLWQDYFRSTNIESRKNMKLHIRHVPKRYWKYLSEKQPN